MRNAAIKCQDAKSCAAMAQIVIRPFIDSAKETRCACPLNKTLAAMQQAQPSDDSLARATAFWDNCNHGVKGRMGRNWCHADARGFYNATWQPDGALCRSMSRFGPPLGKGGDGGKFICDADKLLRSPGCLVVSVGLNDDTRFESDLHSAWPECEIIGYDGTLDAAKTAAVPKFITHLPLNFNASTYVAYAKSRSRVSLLKIDCDGCEYTAIQPWVDNVCTEQIVVEMHKKTTVSPYMNVVRNHLLLRHLHRAGYRIAFLEPNPLYPKLGTEYTLVRQKRCP